MKHLKKFPLDCNAGNCYFNTFVLSEIGEQDKIVSDAMNKIYRCLQQKLPVAENAIFLQRLNGDLKFEHFVKDEPRPERESGYMVGGKGDSGGSIIKKIHETKPGTKKTHVLVGVYNKAVGSTTDQDGRETTYSTDINKKCRMMISKLTEDVVKWIGLVMEYEENCEVDSNQCANEIPSNGGKSPELK